MQGLVEQLCSKSKFDVLELEKMRQTKTQRVQAYDGKFKDLQIEIELVESRSGARTLRVAVLKHVAYCL